MGPAIWSSSMVLVSVSLWSGFPPLSLPGVALFVSVAVALRTLDIERRERKARAALAAHRAKQAKAKAKRTTMRRPPTEWAGGPHPASPPV